MATFEERAAYLRQLMNQVDNMKQFVDSKAQNIQLQESQLKQGTLPNTSPQNLAQNLQNLGPMMAPGNVGDINLVIWPFYFTTGLRSPDPVIAPNETFQTGFSVTQEAAFIFNSYTKAVYLVEGEEGDESWTYLDPDDTQPSSPGLVFTYRDVSSSRQYFNRPIDLDLYGHPRFPTKFPRPIMLLPNQTMQIQFTNMHPTNRYVPFITVFGYRIRVQDAQNFLGLVYA